ncbi:diacylglycerol kinase family protein [Salisediminibacterium beveridgei]|uniref:Diacylglycerol kinase n=1 Tax=Salisediminibacterium beveridgei TaxID=632773 RepID=A0A1D7QUA1_9BACI|nr:diacylglycerol kinase family protein [Salisediminibacterium beveridgei]AOM82591.1 diacylglycerol kinase [Salisediminibacterium beveridgei]
MELKNKRPFFSFRRLRQSFVYAVQGIRFTWQREQNFRIHSVISLAVLILAQLLQVPYLEQVMLLVVIGAVIGMELINTALEHVVDLVVQSYDDRAKVIKDTAAGAVFIFSITAAIIGLMIFIPHVIKWL